MEKENAVVPRSLTDLPDQSLVELAKNKDVAAFEELIGRHEDKLYRLVMRLVRNETDAQEVLQDTFLSAWRKLDGFEGKAQFGSWLYRVATNTGLMLLRSQRRHPSVSVDDVEPEILSRLAAGEGVVWSAGTDWSKRPDDQLQSDELRRRLQAAVDDLPDIQSTVFLLRDVEGLSTEETADILGITVATVKTRLHRARLTLRQAITDYFETV